MLKERGDIDRAEPLLRVSADAGDLPAAWRLAELLAERGDIDELRARVNAGDQFAGPELVKMLAKHGQDEEAQRLHRFGLNPDGSFASR
jgi:hypothetical protein